MQYDCGNLAKSTKNKKQFGINKKMKRISPSSIILKVEQKQTQQNLLDVPHLFEISLVYTINKIK